MSLYFDNKALTSITKADSAPPLAGASKQEAGNGLLDVSAAVDGGRDALGNGLVDVGHGSKATKLLLFLRGHRASEAMSCTGMRGMTPQ